MPQQPLATPTYSSDHCFVRSLLQCHNWQSHSTIPYFSFFHAEQ